MDRLDALKLFVRVVDAGSFSAAARSLRLGQPQVSRAVGWLEARWGAQLIQRSSRRLSLTEAGERAVVRARELLDLADGLDGALKGADRQPVGLLRVSASVAFASAELVPHVPAFLTSHPHVRLELQTSDRRIDIIGDGVDLTFRLGELDDSDLTGLRLGAYRRLLVAAPSYLDRNAAPDHPRELTGHACVVFATTRASASWKLNRGNTGQEVEVRGPVAASSGPLLAEFARQGLGVTLGPDFLFEQDLASGRLVRVLPEWSGPPLSIHALWPRRELPSKARAFLDFMCERIKAC